MFSDLKIPAPLAPARLLIYRPDLTRQKRQRRRAAALAASVGRGVAAVDVLAGWLNVNTDQDVGDLESLLADRFTMHLAELAPSERADADAEAVHAQLALELGWKSLRGHGPREVLRVLHLAGPDGAPRPTVEKVARGGSGAVDDVLSAAFAVVDGDRVKLGPCLRDFVGARLDRPAARRERVQRWLSEVRVDLDADLPGIESAGALAMELAAADSQADLAAALALSLAGRLRMQRKLDSARAAVVKGRAGLERDDARVTALRSALDLELAMIELASGDPSATLARLDRAEQGIEGASPKDAAATADLRTRVRIVRAQAHLAAGRAKEALGLLEEQAGGVCEIVRLQTVAGALLELGTGDPGAVAGAVEGEAKSILPPDSSLGAAVALTRARTEPDEGVDPLLERARVLAGGNLDRPASPALPLALHELGARAAGRGEFESAATLLDEASMLAASLLPRRHPLRCTIAYTRGLLLLSVGETARAERHLERAVDGWKGLGASAHPRALLARATRSWLDTTERGRSGRVAAEAMAEATDELAEQLGPDHATVVRLRSLHEAAVKAGGGQNDETPTVGRGFGDGRHAQD